LWYQYENANVLDAEEIEWTIVVTTDADVDADSVVQRLALHDGLEKRLGGRIILRK
jgi:hypothetical protein